MNQVLITRSSFKLLPQALANTLNGNLTFETTNKDLYIKYGDDWVGLGGSLKQDKLTPGDNIEIHTVGYHEDEVRLADDIKVHTVTLSPKNMDYEWKGSVNLGELEDENVLLLTRYAPDVIDPTVIGGELLAQLTDEDGATTYGTYDFSMTSSGSWSLNGSINNDKALRVCKCKVGDEVYYGLKVPTKRIQRPIISTRDIPYFVEEEYEYTWIETVRNPDKDHIEEVPKTVTYTLNHTNTQSNFQAWWQGQATFSISNSLNRSVNLTNTTFTRNNNAWYYVRMGNLAAMCAGMFDDGNWNENFIKLCDDNRYLYLFIEMNSSFQLRVSYAAVADRVLSEGPYTGLAGVMWYGIATGAEFSEYTGITQGDYFRGSPIAFGRGGSHPLFSTGFTALEETLGYDEIEHSEIRVREVTKYRTEEYISGFEFVESSFAKAKFWFNGWNHIGKGLEPPEGVTGSELLDVEPLAPESEDNGNFKEVYNDMSSEDTVDILENGNLDSTGEDGAPYLLKITGEIGKAALQRIADQCKDPNIQLAVDMSEAYVDSTAKNWDWQVFRHCVSLRSLRIPQGVEKILEMAFMWCTYLRELDLTPSAGTLNYFGCAGGFSTSVGMLTSTRIRDLIIPASVRQFGKYITGSSNLKNFIFAHSGTDSLTSEEWMYCLLEGSTYVTELPHDFHAFMTYSWWNGFIKSYYRGAQDSDDNYGENFTNRTGTGTNGWQWYASNGRVHWTGDFIRSIVLYEPSWNEKQWQAFADQYGWSEELVNKVRYMHGFTTRIQIDEKN